MYSVLYFLFMGLAWLFGALAVAFFVYLVVVNPKEFFSNIFNPLILIYFFPAVLCSWAASWADARRAYPIPKLVNERNSSAGFTVLAIIAAITIFLVSWLLIYLVFSVAMSIRGDGNIIQLFFNAMASIGISSAIGLYVATRLVSKANVNVVWWAFMVLLVGIFLVLLTRASLMGNGQLMFGAFIQGLAGVIGCLLVRRSLFEN